MNLTAGEKHTCALVTQTCRLLKREKEKNESLTEYVIEH